VTRPAARLSLIFFLSGAAALLFETLWFRLSGLTFGNTAWASALVLTSFMSGLAAGNLLAVRIAGNRDAFRLYATIEGGIAITGLTLVLLLPSTQNLFAPFFRALLGSDFALNAARLLLAFLLLCVPTTLMGATLPTVVGALSRSEQNYGRALGLLYGWNTMGAVAGSLAGELLLIEAFGVRGTGVVAAGLSGAAAVIAWIGPSPGLRPPSPRAAGRGLSGARFLLAAALSGFSLLALEVIWFRFVELFIFATSLAFAVMLAVVLLGISIGALAASAILRRSPDADSWAATIAAVSGAILIASYAGFDPQLLSRGTFAPGMEQKAVLVDSLRLMLPVSLFSGLLFTFIGRSVERVLRDETRAAAVLTAFNTIGAAIGSGIAGFVLIPLIGIERAFFAIAIVYLAVAALLVPRERRARIAAAATGAILLALLVLFPFGMFRSTFIPLAARDYLDANAEVAAVREGPIETAVYLRTSIAGQPYMYRLFTNGYSMASTAFTSKRYMSMFTWVPLALRPRAKNAVLISYGVGVTATSLVHSPQLQSIDVVDISRNILDLSDLVWPGAANPLRDPRVHVHVEDGRFFLRTTGKRFDLITSEPPPPKSAGVVSLYTEEYFRLVHDRLSDDGIASYWLPVYQLNLKDAQTIVSAFCDAFDDCSLWSGAGTEWMLVGSRRPSAVSEADFSRQFQEPAAGTWMRWIGVETPEMLAATFLTDADGLRRFAAGAPPLTDDRPLRLSTVITGGLLPEYLAMHANGTQEFARSGFIGRTLPAGIRERTMRTFGIESVIDRRFNSPPQRIDPQTLEAVLRQTQLRILPRLVMQTDMWLESIARNALARGSRDPQMLYLAGAGELADRHYAAAAELFRQAVAGGLRGAEPFAGLASKLAGEQNPSR
jgi:spermidine synthase